MALLMRMSSRPNVLSACSTISLAPSQVADDLLATASPPLALISLTTLSASAPLRTPMSLTTTRAPCAASRRACSRPMPPPAPVTIATLPSRRRGDSVVCMCGPIALAAGLVAGAARAIEQGERVRGVQVLPHLSDLAAGKAEEVHIDVLV